VSQVDQHCDHCHLPLPEGEDISATINDQKMHFCCYGCKTVCETIYGAGMDGFYQRLSYQQDIDGDIIKPPPEINSELEVYDLDEVQGEFVDALGDIREIHLLVEGIHCAACVWLIERSLDNATGVVHGNVNLSAKKLHLKWDNRETKLSAILHTLGQIGYAAVPFDPEAAEGQIKIQSSTLFRLVSLALPP